MKVKLLFKILNKLLFKFIVFNNKVMRYMNAKIKDLRVNMYRDTYKSKSWTYCKQIPFLASEVLYDPIDPIQ